MQRLGVLPLMVLLVACEANKTHPPNDDPYEAGVAPPLSCVPNLDGVIDASELQPVLGMPATYTVNPASMTRPVDVAGTVDANGHLTWDWGASYAGDQVANIEATAITGKWYASSFPSATQESGKQLFVTPFDAGDTLEGVYTQDDTGLYLLGIASTQTNPPQGETLYVYDSPIQLYPFPLKPGVSWKSIGVIRNGMLRGLPYAGQDEYDGTDVATGQLVLPDFTFQQAHRVQFVVTLTPSAGTSNPIVQRQDSFLFECFGEVGRATSVVGETNDDFTTASELRRLGM